MATAKQKKAARQNVTKAQEAAASKQTIAHMPKRVRTELGQQGAAVAQRKRTGGDAPKTRAELYEIAKQRDLPGRSKMARDELARKLGEKLPQMPDGTRARPPVLAQPAPGRQTWIAPPTSRVSNAGCGAVAGPRATEPSAIRNTLPCQGQVRQPSASSPSDSGPDM